MSSQAGEGQYSTERHKTPCSSHDMPVKWALPSPTTLPSLLCPCSLQRGLKSFPLEIVIVLVDNKYMAMHHMQLTPYYREILSKSSWPWMMINVHMSPSCMLTYSGQEVEPDVHWPESTVVMRSTLRLYLGPYQELSPTWRPLATWMCLVCGCTEWTLQRSILLNLPSTKSSPIHVYIQETITTVSSDWSLIKF